MDMIENRYSFVLGECKKCTGIKYLATDFEPGKTDHMGFTFKFPIKLIKPVALEFADEGFYLQ